VSFPICHSLTLWTQTCPIKAGGSVALDIKVSGLLNQCACFLDSVRCIPFCWSKFSLAYWIMSYAIPLMTPQDSESIGNIHIYYHCLPI
jgi:hypothetical protein